MKFLFKVWFLFKVIIPVLFFLFILSALSRSCSGPNRFTGFEYVVPEKSTMDPSNINTYKSPGYMSGRTEALPSFNGQSEKQVISEPAQSKSPVKDSVNLEKSEVKHQQKLTKRELRKRKRATRRWLRKNKS